MPNILMLDTHALLWHASESPRLSENAIKAIDRADVLGVSAISAWEIGMLVQKGRLSLMHEVSDWLNYSYKLPKVEWIPVDTRIAVLSTRLPEMFHGDPADRIIVATAMSRGATLVTADRVLQAYPHVQAVW